MSEPAFHEENISYKQLLLDPNNYRFQDSPDFAFADERRFHEPNVQERAYRRLRKDEGILFLKNSIITNGFIPIERLVLRPYRSAEDMYLVLEGNRRLAAIKWIAEDYDAGVNIPPQVMMVLEGIPSVVVGETQDPAFHEALMGVRHVTGIKEWGGYQRAKLVVTLRDKYGLSTAEVADRIGMTAHEVNRRYRAYKALQQMEHNENYGAYARSDMYPLFHEAITQPPVREWLGWDEVSAQFIHDEQLEHFYGLITPTELDDGKARDPKLPTRETLRELKDIIINPEAKRILLDPGRSFLDAVSVAKRDQLSRSWATQVAEAITAMHSISVLDLQQFSREDLAQIEKLRESAGNLLELYKKFIS